MNDSSKNSLIALVVLSVAIILFQSGSAFAVKIFATIGPIATVALRQGASALLMGAFSQIWKIDYSKIDYRALIPYGLSLGIMNSAFYYSIDKIPMGVAVAIEFSGPLLVSVFTSRKKIDFLWILIAAIGILLLLPTHEFAQKLDPIGLIFAAIAAAAWGAYIVFGHNLGKSMGETQAVALGFVVSLFISLPLVLIIGVKQNVPLINWVGFALVLTFFSGAIPYSMEMFALKRMKKSTFSLLMSLDPAFAALSGFIFLQQKLVFLQILAIGFIIVASIGSSLGNKNTPPIDEPLI